MSENKNMNIHQYLVHAATNPKLQATVAGLSGDDLHKFLIESGLSKKDAGLLVAANGSHEGTKALVDNLNARPQGWTYSSAAEAQGWTYSATATAQDWTYSISTKTE